MFPKFISRYLSVKCKIEPFSPSILLRVTNSNFPKILKFKYNLSQYNNLITSAMEKSQMMMGNNAKTLTTTTYI